MLCGFKKQAYDLVWRNSLLYKLMKYGISTKMKNMISSIYANVKSYVKVNGTLSKSLGCITEAINELKNWKSPIVDLFFPPQS